nr:hypothetical protein [Tanacetum cinerariifolium]
PYQCTVSSTINAARTNEVDAISELPFDPDMPALEDVGTFEISNDDEDDGKAKKSVRLMLDKLFEMELEFILLFCSTVIAKTINGEVQIHARVDGKKIIISEAPIRRVLQFADEEGVDCLPNSTIFKQLASMGPKTIAWNEFSSNVAYAIISLATNQKFNFSK